MVAALRTGADVGRRLVLSRSGFIILAHAHLHRVAELARFLAQTGPVVIHADAKIGAKGLAENSEDIRVISTRKCHWGMMGLVDATLDGARLLLDHHGVSHVCLLSGSCLPIRPPGELADFFTGHPETDFIESVSPSDSTWVQDGLGQERFTLYFPVGWKRHRRLFDRLVDLQRSCRVSRRMPAGLQPHLGLQWWCLTRATLETILNHPRLPEWRRHFAWTWIPDESFFQTIVRHVATGTVRCESLTLQRFDADGRPYVFHDDHAAVLEGRHQFFARKIDPDASALYQRFLGGPCQRRSVGGGSKGSASDAALEVARSSGGDSGQAPIGPTRMPSGITATSVETVRPYVVFIGRDDGVLEDVRASNLGTKFRFHGRVFGPAQAVLADDFGGGGPLGPGCLPTDPVQRDYRPAQYLARLLWIGRDRPTAFLFDPADNAFVREQMLSDPNARLVLIGDSQDLAARLAEPPTSRRGRRISTSEQRAWFRVIPPQDGDPVRRASQALDLDLDDPQHWILPGSANNPR